MKKYHVIDAEGAEYQVEELDEEIVEEEKVDDEPEAAALSAEEIDALKKLAGVADKLIAMTQANDSDEDMDEDNLVDEDEEEKVDDECEEEVIDTDEEEEKKPTHDSKKSFGALEKKSKKVVDNSLEDEVSNAWAKRFGGCK